MSATVTKLSSNKVRIDFTVDAERFEKGIIAAYRKNVGKINIPGFRKGKAPRKVIETHYGEGVFYEDAIEDIFPEVYSQAIDENKLDVVSRPEFTLKNAAHGEPLEFSVEVYVSPDVTLGDYKALPVHKNTTEVTEDDVKAEIERARERAATFEDVTDRPAKLDDQANIDYEGTVDGEAFEGGTSKGYNLTLGSGSFIPGFEEGVVGMEIGAEKDIPVTFPEDYHAENLKGKAANFHVKLNSLRVKELPALDDEFAKDVSEFDTFEEYKNSVREKLVKDAEQKDTNAFESELMGMAVENAQMDIPEAMIESEVEGRIDEIRRRISYQGLDFDMYLKYTGMTLDSLKENLRPEAEQNVKTRLTIDAIIKAENIEATEEDADAEMASYAERSGMELDQLKEQVGDKKDYFKDLAKVKKVYDLMKETAVEPTEDDKAEEKPAE